jgi:hypothetical protein
VNNWIYKVTHSPSVNAYTQPVAWNPAWDGASKLDVAMYAVFTGGGDGTWTQKYTWTITYPHKDVDLPQEIIDLVGYHPNGTYSYWKFQFSGIGSGFDVVDGAWYAGWCAEQTKYMNQGQTYQALLWSSLTPSLPIRLRVKRAGDPGLGWDNVNWILNNKQGTFWDVQAAIWYMLGNGGYPSDPDAQAMVAGAITNGDGWLPSGGDLLAVILEPYCDQQMVFIEIDP